MPKDVDDASRLRGAEDSHRRRLGSPGWREALYAEVAAGERRRDAEEHATKRSNPAQRKVLQRRLRRLTEGLAGRPLSDEEVSNLLRGKPDPPDDH